MYVVRVKYIPPPSPLPPYSIKHILFAQIVEQTQMKILSNQGLSILDITYL